MILGSVLSEIAGREELRQTDDLCTFLTRLLDELERWKLGDELLREALHGQSAEQAVARFRASHDITLATDGYALVRVDGNELMAPVVGDRKTFGVYPLALSNPIFFDVNNNGRYDPAYKHGEKH